MLKVIIKEAGKKAEVKLIKDKLATFQHLVNGNIEAINTPFANVALICNDEGKWMPTCKPNFYIREGSPYEDLLFGTVIFSACDENGANRSLNTWEIKHILQWLSERVLPIGNEKGEEHIKYNVKITE